MTHTTLAAEGHVAGGSSPAAATPPTDAIVRGRRGMTVALTAATVAIGIALGLAFGTTGVLLFALPLPVPLALLWLSADVVRADERRVQTRRV